jgi:hypothetical protein
MYVLNNVVRYVEILCQIWRHIRQWNIFPVEEDRNQDVWIAGKLVILFPKLKLLWMFEVKSSPKHIINV